MSGWIGVDLDGTLAFYDGWKGADHIGRPIYPMVERVMDWVGRGIEVRIFTARVSDDPTGEARTAIERWCLNNLGFHLPITNVKDYGMVELWDDRAITVEQNTGRQIGDKQPRFTP